MQSIPQMAEIVQKLPELRCVTRTNSDDIVDEDIMIEEIEWALKHIKCGKRGGGGGEKTTSQNIKKWGGGGGGGGLVWTVWVGWDGWKGGGQGGEGRGGRGGEGEIPHQGTSQGSL